MHSNRTTTLRTIYTTQQALTMTTGIVLFTLSSYGQSSVSEAQYEQWKKDKQERWHTHAITNALKQQEDLLLDVSYGLERSKSILGFTEAICAYNYLRELHTKDPLLPQVATTVRSIDTDWLSRVDYLIWQDLKQEYWKYKDITTFSKKQLNLIFDILTAQRFLQEDPKNSTQQRNILYAYNFLRELFGLSTSTCFSALDATWLQAVYKKLAYRALIRRILQPV